MRTSYKPGRKPGYYTGSQSRPEPILTAKQVKWLLMEALAAYNVAKKHGAHDGLTFDEWRKAQLEEEFTTLSFRKLKYREFERALNLFFKWTGKKQFPNPQSILESDIPARKQYWYFLRQAINDLRKVPQYHSKNGENSKVIAYVATILKNKFGIEAEDPTPEGMEIAVNMLRATQIQQLGITINNRIRNLKKEGDPLSRNKKQRADTRPHRKRHDNAKPETD